MSELKDKTMPKRAPFDVKYVQISLALKGLGTSKGTYNFVMRTPKKNNMKIILNKKYFEIMKFNVN